MAIDLCRIGDNDARILGDGHVWDSFKVVAGPCRLNATVRWISIRGRLGKGICNVCSRIILMVRISFRRRIRSVQIDLGAILLQRQTLGNLIGELVEIRVVLVIVLGNGAVKVVRHVLADLGVGSIALFAIGIAHDLLLDGGDTSFLVDLNGRVSHDSENGGRTRLAITNSVSLGHKEPVAMLKAGGNAIGRCLLLCKIVYSSSNLIGNVVRTDAKCITGSLYLIRDPVRSILSGSYSVARFYGLNNALDSRLHFLVCPSDIGNFTVLNISRKNMIAIELGMVVLNVRDFHRAIGRCSRTLSCKRHGHRGHHTAEAQRCGEACCYCQACDVLVHAHLLFLCFLLEFHLI